MLIFGHVGLTLGIATLAGRVSKKEIEAKNSLLASSNINTNNVTFNSNPSTNRLIGLSLLWNQLDMRLILIGSLLPDIDKLIGQVFFRETFSNGRIISHTLLFLILLSLLGLFLYIYRRQAAFLALAFGTFTHLIFDEMWQSPGTLFWPLYGFNFGKFDVSNWLYDILHALFTNPRVYIPELVGFAIVVWFTIELVRKRRIISFLKHGTSIW